eukprot:TRINITY_DN535_c0_g1_i1.p1 TRINITY_DN535_c0_g1~~TRINITY_DN535_c0_g1_i1.p1  ORF type:complete len:442 (-),score=103.62 TRINITY_DN535_c0_g1_i1:286-1611(-)
MPGEMIVPLATMWKWLWTNYEVHPDCSTKEFSKGVRVSVLATRLVRDPAVKAPKNQFVERIACIFFGKVIPTLYKKSTKGDVLDKTNSIAFLRLRKGADSKKERGSAAGAATADVVVPPIPPIPSTLNAELLQEVREEITGRKSAQSLASLAAHSPAPASASPGPFASAALSQKASSGQSNATAAAPAIKRSHSAKAASVSAAHAAQSMVGQKRASTMQGEPGRAKRARRDSSGGHAAGGLSAGKVENAGKVEKTGKGEKTEKTEKGEKVRQQVAVPVGAAGGASAWLGHVEAQQDAGEGDGEPRALQRWPELPATFCDEFDRLRSSMLLMRREVEAVKCTMRQRERVNQINVLALNAEIGRLQKMLGSDARGTAVPASTPLPSIASSAPAAGFAPSSTSSSSAFSTSRLPPRSSSASTLASSLTPPSTTPKKPSPERSTT